ncbi:multiple RNA-binding domain-containing protein 1, putative [Plasmodium ovale]|uniref:Multiple RNA-binding domain-containing protein 1, putative n=1 Tax=Plasmodium ovale TaxID=36330 RepID=A0A1D3UA22_PLAOA|nr:multiple RNA-binding domain-containing protein 1, putative [Plasmodium ovale]
MEDRSFAEPNDKNSGPVMGNNTFSHKKQNEANYERTRLIIKNIPKYMNEIDLKKHFFKMKGNYEFKITDIKIMKRKKVIKNKEEFESRKICFIGFMSNRGCENFKKSFNNTYINTSKISIEDAFSPIISKQAEMRNHTYNLYQRNGLEKTKKEETKKSIQILKNEHFINKTIPVKKTKAGMSTTRTHVIFMDDQMEENQEKVKKKENKKEEKAKKAKKMKKNREKVILLGEGTQKDNASDRGPTHEQEKLSQEDCTQEKTKQEDDAVDKTAEEENALDWLKGISQKKTQDEEKTEKKENLVEGEEEDKNDDRQKDTSNEGKQVGDKLEYDSGSENKNTGKIIIFNLPPVSEQDVKSLCERYGPVVEAKIFKNMKKGNVQINLDEGKDKKSNEDFFIKLLKENNDTFMDEKHGGGGKKKKNNETCSSNKQVNSCSDDKNTEVGEPSAHVEEVKNALANYDLTNVRAYAFVSFVFPSSCERAKEGLHDAIYRGKILSVKYAKEKYIDFENSKKSKNNILIKLSKESKTSYKKILEIQKKRNCQNENVWNLLYTDINASIHNFCKENNCSRESILNIRDKNIAVNVSLTETYIINKMKEWIRKEGIHLEAFEQVYKKGEETQVKVDPGENETAGENIQEDAKKVIKYKRSDDTIVVKNLAMHTNQRDIINMFKKYGILKKVSFSPYNNVAIMQFENSENAKKAFVANSYTRYRKLPLYLEWAPINLFEKTEKTAENAKSDMNGTVSAAEPVAAPNEATEGNNRGAYESESSDEEGTHASVYIKNLNFSTKEEDFKKLFEKLDGFITCNIVKSKKVITKREHEKNQKENDQKYISQGYGFAEFKSKEQAIDAIKKLTATTLDDHILELSLSRNRVKKKSNKNNDEKKIVKEKKKVTKKLLIKNLAFQVTKEELRKLFSSFGNIKSVRIPKNAYNRSRGYAFVEFMSKSECQTAIESLQHTHLYGRHLIIDFADDFIFEQNVNEYDKLKDEGNVNRKGAFITSEQAKRKTIYEHKKGHEMSESKRRKLQGDLENV